MPRNQAGRRGARVLSTTEQHQLAVAKQTLRMPPAMLGVMGGMSLQEARRVYRKLTGRDASFIEAQSPGRNPPVRKISHSVQDFASALRFLGDKHERKLAHHTTVRVHEWSGPQSETVASIAVRLHGTDIVIYYRDGRVRLDSGGYQSATTKQRMNQLALGIGIAQKDFEWTVHTRQGVYPFFDGIVIDREGNEVTSQGRNFYATRNRDLLRSSHDMLDNPPRGPGKFSSDLDAALWDLSLDGADAEFGDVEEDGYHAALLVRVTRQELEDAADSDTALYRAAVEDVRRLAPGGDFPLHAIVYTDSQGFVSVELFALASQAQKVFDGQAREYDEWLAEGEGGDE